MVGIVEYQAENRPDKLWVASDSKSLEDQRWVSSRFPSQSRIAVVLVEKDDNILTPEGLSAVRYYLYDLDLRTSPKSDTSPRVWLAPRLVSTIDTSLLIHVGEKEYAFF